MLEQLLSLPGFIYEINGSYFFLGKWICKECIDVDACDCVFMYGMCRRTQEEPDTNMYFQKIRAYSDFALEIPYDPVKIKNGISSLLENLSERASESLQKQITAVTEDLQKYC